MVKYCVYCKHWSTKDAFITVIPDVETDLMGDRIVIRQCDVNKSLLTPGNYYCDKFEERNNA